MLKKKENTDLIAKLNLSEKEAEVYLCMKFYESTKVWGANSVTSTESKRLPGMDDFLKAQRVS